MPEIQGDTFDVTAEEQRYLRRSFRRFALPYLIGMLAIAALIAMASGTVSARGGAGAGDELNSLVAEAASLRAAIAVVRDELRERNAEAGARLEALEDGVAKLRVSADGESAAELGSRLDHAHQRIQLLEGRFAEIEAGRAAAPTQPRAPAWPPAGSDLP